jgi:hypothetical protein
MHVAYTTSHACRLSAVPFQQHYVCVCTDPCIMHTVGHLHVVGEKARAVPFQQHYVRMYISCIMHIVRHLHVVSEQARAVPFQQHYVCVCTYPCIMQRQSGTCMSSVNRHARYHSSNLDEGQGPRSCTTRRRVSTFQCLCACGGVIFQS